MPGEGLDIADWLGIAGFLVYATADILLALRVLNSEQIRFYLIYAVAAVLILSSLMVDFNLGAALTEAMALITCLVAIVLRATRPRAIEIRHRATRRRVGRASPAE